MERVETPNLGHPILLMWKAVCSSSRRKLLGGGGGGCRVEAWVDSIYAFTQLRELDSFTSFHE
jgi:hypothetical protein